MNITKVRGIVEEERGNDSARIKVISFKKNGQYEASAEKIKEEFPHSGYVFSPRFFQEFRFLLHTIVEFSVVRANYKIEKGDEYILDIHKDCKQVGFPVFEAPDNFLLPNGSINQPSLKNALLEDNSNLYFWQGSFLYGPFKTAGGEIVPKVGVDVGKYHLEPGMMISVHDSNYLVSTPQHPIGRVDAMTTQQLGDWLKSQLKGFTSMVDFGAFKRAMETFQGDELARVHMKRALLYLDQLAMTMQEIKKLADLSPQYAQHYEIAIGKVKEEMVSAMLEPLRSEIEFLNEAINQRNVKVRELSEQELHFAAKVENAKNEYESILRNKQRLIDDIKVHASVAPALIHSRDRLMTYELQEYSGNSSQYSNLDELSTMFDTIFPENSKAEKHFGKKIAYQFKAKKCLLCDSVATAVKIARVLGNVRLMIQQAEPDWLKFEHLYNNGFKTICEQAVADANRIHFYVLEDMNVASIECYGRPVMDVNTGIRKRIPALNIPWPRNLWFIAVPVDGFDTPSSFGLPLVPNSFEGWGAIPRNLSVQDISSCETKSVSLEILLDHDKLVTANLNQYFNKP